VILDAIVEAGGRRAEIEFSEWEGRPNRCTFLWHTPS